MKNKTIIKLLITVLFSLFMIAGCGEEEETGEPQVPRTTPQEQQQPDTLTQVDTVSGTDDRSEPGETTRRSETAEIPNVYEVKSGETLASIAHKFYADSTRWFEIFALNESDIDHWNYIYPGQHLKMPQDNEMYNQ